MRLAEEPRHPMETPGYYRIRLEGRLSQNWSDRLGGMQVTCTETDTGAPVTTLEGWLPDQAALSGVLNSVYVFGLAILSVARSETGAPQL